MADPIERVDTLVDHASLPAPRVRQHLRMAAGLSQAEVAAAVGVKRLAVTRWELGQTTPRQPHREVYKHLLRRLAKKYPAVVKEGESSEQ